MAAYCQACGSRVTQQLVDDRMREVCGSCGTVFYAQWKVSAGVRVVKEGSLLLVQRGIDPWRGKWHMPAGYVEVDEEPYQAAERETLEETGLNVRAGKLVDCYTDTEDPRGNAIVLVYDAEIVGGNLSTSAETESVGFFSPEEVLTLPLAGMSAEIEIKDWLSSVQ